MYIKHMVASKQCTYSAKTSWHSHTTLLSTSTATGDVYSKPCSLMLLSHRDTRSARQLSGLPKETKQYAS